MDSAPALSPAKQLALAKKNSKKGWGARNWTNTLRRKKKDSSAGAMETRMVKVLTTIDSAKAYRYHVIKAGTSVKVLDNPKLVPPSDAVVVIVKQKKGADKQLFLEKRALEPPPPPTNNELDDDLLDLNMFNQDQAQQEEFEGFGNFAMTKTTSNSKLVRTSTSNARPAYLVSPWVKKNPPHASYMAGGAFFCIWKSLQ